MSHYFIQALHLRARVLTFCVHVAIAPLFLAQLFEGAVRGVERQQLGGAWLAKRLAQLHQRGTQV